MRLVEALGGIAAIPHFFLYRLTWNAAKNKYEKSPCHVDGRPLGKDEGGPPAMWADHATAVANLAQLRARDGHNGWTLGWTVTKDCGYWFLDADNVLNEAGEVSEVGRYLLNALPDVFVEWSSSGRGLHWLGRGLVPPHSSRPAVAQAAGLEFYTDERGVAFGLTDEATGSADVDHTAAISVIAAHWFKPNELLTNAPSGVDPSYCGPHDDAELLRKAMDSGSMDSLLKGKARFADLWTRNVTVLQNTYPSNEPGKEFGESEADQALAFLLAFWTGRDAARIERLMRQSALKRDKWETNEHATYLAGTIAKACAGCSKVYVMPQVVQKLAVATTEDERANVDLWEQRILKATEDELRNEVLPSICADSSIAKLDRQRLASAFQRWYKERHLTKLPMADCLGYVTPRLAKADIDIPEFFNEYIYIQRGDVFYHIVSGVELTRTSFKATYNRMMPKKANGESEDAAAWCTDRWQMPTASDTMYVPGFERVFKLGGKTFVNTYREPPAASAYTDVGVAGIGNFAKHLQHMCGMRDEVYAGFVDWLAHNVQHPGVKIRYVPLVKGHQGSGKSIIGEVLQAALGWENVKPVGSGAVMGGTFTDWAHGACVIVLEEIWMEGKARYAVANTIKENITNDRVSINRKNLVGLDILNISNFIAFTNHNDAVPLTDEDRRWWVIFSPFVNNADQDVAMGLVDRNGFFGAIKRAIKECPGEFRKWLLEHKIGASFNPNGNAPMTAEKANMRRAGEDESMAIARSVIDSGAYGVCKDVFSSSALATAMRVAFLKAGIDEPKGRKMNHLATNLSFIAAGEVKWDGKAHTVWTIRPMTNTEIRTYLDDTKTPTLSPTLSPTLENLIKPVV